MSPSPSVGISPTPSGDNDNISLNSSHSDLSSFCAPFPNDECLDAYLASIAAPRELICPITQELVKDPVVAEDGHTYERSSLVTWFAMGRNRSPVTNSLLSNTAVNNLVTNIAVASMALAHREKLGRELVRICQGVKERRGHCRDSGVRIEGLLDAGADLNGRGIDGNTPLHLLIQSGNIHLATHLLNHDANVTLTNDAGLDCIAMALDRSQNHCNTQRNQSHGPSLYPSASEWISFIDELKRKETLEKVRAEARERARNQANEEHRVRQQTLATHGQENNAISIGALNGTYHQGLGRLDNGVGYFPSLAALQFQSAIPGPSPSLAEYENKEKERLDRVLKVLGSFVLLYFLLS